MSDYDPNAEWVNGAVLSWSEINAELRALEGKNDPESNSRRAGLIDDLMCADMSLGPMRKAMAEKKEPPQPESSADMAADKSEPSNQSPPRRTMSPMLRELLKDPCFQQAKSPGGAYIVTGIRPPGPPTPPPAPQAAEPTNPPTESSCEKQ